MGTEAAIVLWIALIAATGIGMLAASVLCGPRRRRAAKLDPYECGVPLFQDSRERFPVRFYLMAIVFILFDVETVFLLPWAVRYQALGVAGLVEILLFMGVLGVGYVYLWRRGVLDWE
jgi:NADH-quinone oxidoreductase subunit A